MALLTKYVDHAAADTTGDGSIGDPWKYLYQAMGAIKTDAGTNNYKIYVKASETYGTDGTSPNPLESDDIDHDGAGGDAGALVYIDQIPAGVTSPNVWEGYKTTPGDGGIVSINCNYDGGSKITNGIWCQGNVTFATVFKNFDIQNAGGAGINGGTDADSLTFKNVRVKGSASSGLIADNFISFENCVFDNNAGLGVDVDAACTVVSSIFKNNSSYGMRTQGVTYYNCLIYDNGNIEQIITNGVAHIFQCTIDANDGAASRCIRQDTPGFTLNTVNCILVDAAIGILADGDLGDLVISRNNLFNGNTDDASGYQTEYDGGDGAPSTGNGVGNLGHVTGVPGFTGVYVPGANPQSAGLDAHFTNAFWVSFDGANNPPL